MHIEIVNDVEPTGVAFKFLNTGDCFALRIGDALCFDTLYMKLDNGIVQNDSFSTPGLIKNSIDLDTGKLCYINLTEEVIPVEYPNVKIVVSKCWVGLYLERRQQT